MTPLSLLKGIIMSKISIKELVEVNSKALKTNTKAAATIVVTVGRPVVRTAFEVALVSFAIIGLAATINKNK